MAQRRAILAAEVDDLQVAGVPRFLREHGFQVAFGADDRGAVGQAPPCGETVDVRVHGKRRHAEGLGHHDARRLVADAGQRLEECPVGPHLATGIDDLVGGGPDVPRLRRGEPDLADHVVDRVRIERRHLRRRRRDGKQFRGNFVDLLVRRLSRERHGDEQRVRVGMGQRDGWIRVEVIEHPPDPLGLRPSTHEDTVRGAREARWGQNRARTVA